MYNSAFYGNFPEIAVCPHSLANTVKYRCMIITIQRTDMTKKDLTD